MKKFILVLVFVIASYSCAFASEPIIEAGFKAFKETGAEAAFKTWSTGGPLDSSKEKILTATAQFGQIGAYYGKYISHEYLFSKVVSQKNKIVFVIMNLENGPLFFRFLVFQNSEGKWILPNFKFNTEPEQILPSELLFIK